MRDLSEWYNLLSPLPICFWSRYLYYQLNNDYVSRQITIILLHKAYFSLARNNVLLSMATNLDSTNYEITDVWKHDSLNYFVQSLDTHSIITPWIKANTKCGMCAPWREWMNHQNAWIYKWSVYLQTYNISCIRRNKHDLFMIFCLNTCSEPISKRHVFVHGSRGDVIICLRIPGIIFHPVNGNRVKIFPNAVWGFSECAPGTPGNRKWH